jgi:hypothetical protein
MEILKFLKKRYAEIGLVLIALIYLVSFILRADPFWARNATIGSIFVLLPVAVLRLVIRNGVEKP